MCFGLAFSRVPTSHDNNYCSVVNYAHVTYRVYNIRISSPIIVNILINIHIGIS